MKKIISILQKFINSSVLTASIVLFPFKGTAEDATHALEDKSYVVEVLKAGDALFTNENIEFSNGKFETTFMEEKGFEKADYSTSKHEGSISWKAISKNKSGDSLSWEGLESEGKIQGSITKTSGRDSGTTWSFKSAPRE